MFNDILKEELDFFISKVSKSQRIVRGVIQEFVSRTLQRMVYGTTLLNKTDSSGMGPNEKFHRESFTSASNLREVLLHHYFPFLDKLRRKKKEDITERKASSNVLSLESQLRKQNVEHAAILAFGPLQSFSW
jgi:hypothetical protein